MEPTQPQDQQRYRQGPAWNSGALAARRDNFRVNPKRICSYCRGYHYDSMCRKRNAATPRVYYNNTDASVPLYTVDTTDDPEYDREHEEFINAYFMQGHTMDDFYRMCHTWEDGYDYEVVDCGLAKATQSLPLKAPPTIAVHETTASRSIGVGRFADTTMRVPTPKMVNRRSDSLIIHHIDEQHPTPEHQCKCCPAKFRKRNKPFAHLQTSNHYMAADVYVTPNDPSAEHDPEVVKSTAPPTFGTGYAFRTFNYLEMPVRLSKESEDTWVCLDTGAGMSLVDREWLAKACPDATILTRTSSVSVRGIDNRTQKTSSYVVLQISIPGHHNNGENGTVNLAEIRREFHIVGDLRCKMIVGEDIIEPEGIVIDSQSRKASIKACDGFAFKIRITPKGRQVLHRRVRSMNRVSVPPDSKALIPIKLKPLPGDRDYEFTPVYDGHTAYLAKAGGLLRAVVDSRTDAVVFHNRSQETVTVHKDAYLGYIADFTAETYHACVGFDPDEYPTLFDAASNGDWKNNDDAPLRECGLPDPACAMSVTTDPSADTTRVQVDINCTDDISAAQINEIVVLVSRYHTVFEDRGTVAREPDEDYMRITLRPGAVLPNKGPYNNSAKDRAFIDVTFDGYHRQGKLEWAPQGVHTACPAFVVWQKEKGRVVVTVVLSPRTNR
jgi:hypothetical protein